MTPKRTAQLVGVLFLIGDVMGILSVVVTGPSLGTFSEQDPSYLVKVAAQQNTVIFGALLLLAMGLSLAFIPIVLYPVAKKFNETLAVGYLVFRGALETVITIGMVVCGLVVVLVSQRYSVAGPSGASVVQNAGAVLMEVHGRLNALLEIVFPVGALMLYGLLYRYRLVPWWLSGWGLVGAVLYLGAGVAFLFGPEVQWALIPLGIQEVVMAIWLIVKGFNPSVVQEPVSG